MSGWKEEGETLLEEDAGLALGQEVGAHFDAAAVGEADVAGENRVEDEADVDPDEAGAACDMASEDGRDDGRVVAVDRRGRGRRGREDRSAGREEDGDGVADGEEQAEDERERADFGFPRGEAGGDDAAALGGEDGAADGDERAGS